jgi:hypothetical protein
MAGFVFNRGGFELLGGSPGCIWTTAAIRFRLQPTAQGANNLDADVMTGLGSTEATATITPASKVGPTLDDAVDHVKFTSANAVFPNAALAIGACNRMLIFRFVTDDTDSIPIAYCDITPVTPNGGDVTVTMDALGWFYMQQHA